MLCLSYQSFERTIITFPIAELVIGIGIPIKEAKAEMETHPVIEKLK